MRRVFEERKRVERDENRKQRLTDRNNLSEISFLKTHKKAKNDKKK